MCVRGKKLNKYFQGWSWGVCPCEGLFVCAKGAKFFHVHQWAQIFVFRVRKRRKSFCVYRWAQKAQFFVFCVRKRRERAQFFLFFAVGDLSWLYLYFWEGAASLCCPCPKVKGDAIFSKILSP